MGTKGIGAAIVAGLDVAVQVIGLGAQIASLCGGDALAQSVYDVLEEHGFPGWRDHAEKTNEDTIARLRGDS